MVDSVAGLDGLRVLVVEDEMLVSMLVEDMLTEFGCAIVGPAPDLDQAMALATESELDAAILDVNVGGRQIFPVADQLKARGIPFAFASGYGEAGLVEAHRGALVLQKPFRQGDLERVLKELAAKRG
ncbi:MAG: response regulator [Caulobacteraceae bacterium]|nr:MAG: response regulator [Caulobacteraceae bacterium]